jgi:hypothetical protein
MLLLMKPGPQLNFDLTRTFLARGGAITAPGIFGFAPDMPPSHVLFASS